ncbi:hypothetical protein HPP92_005162 [Vanilla planifolia]|uniref:Uncharacterized protein n=1 Tax=Vanilla planifolia TaxID=51239 RepID=A0A835RI74_VANPL|nr:hypothetical protein HPP92_005162 [Vanilla planifolia]
MQRIWDRNYANAKVRCLKLIACVSHSQQPDIKRDVVAGSLNATRNTVNAIKLVLGALSCQCIDCGNIHHTKQEYAKMCRIPVGHFERSENDLTMGSSTPNQHILQTNNSNGYHVELQPTMASQLPLSRGGEWHGFSSSADFNSSHTAQSTNGLLSGSS